MNLIFQLMTKIFGKIRTIIVKNLIGVQFKTIGKYCKIRGSNIKVGKNVSLGDFCWIEAVSRYQKQSFSPIIEIQDEVAMSDFVHISSIKKILIKKGVLIGSKVYIGDHSHGHYKNMDDWSKEKKIMPKLRDLADENTIEIGENCWIGDGVVILAGTIIGDNCVVGANSVVQGTFNSNVLIAGLPAKILKEYE